MKYGLAQKVAHFYLFICLELRIILISLFWIFRNEEEEEGKSRQGTVTKSLHHLVIAYVTQFLSLAVPENAIHSCAPKIHPGRALLLEESSDKIRCLHLFVEFIYFVLTLNVYSWKTTVTVDDLGFRCCVHVKPFQH